jgi:hypothetical protein
MKDTGHIINNNKVPSFHQEHRLSTSSFHFLLSLAIGLNSLQLLFPASVNVLLCQLVLGLPVSKGLPQVFYQLLQPFNF